MIGSAWNKGGLALSAHGSEENALGYWGLGEVISHDFL